MIAHNLLLAFDLLLTCAHDLSLSFYYLLCLAFAYPSILKVSTLLSWHKTASLPLTTVQASQAQQYS
jgi:hypothetical protein